MALYDFAYNADAEMQAAAPGLTELEFYCPICREVHAVDPSVRVEGDYVSVAITPPCEHEYGETELESVYDEVLAALKAAVPQSDASAAIDAYWADVRAGSYPG